jgi:hypothetical protein
MAQSWYQLDWIWTTTGWCLAAVALALLAWALFRDRSRGRKRCPKCWYDMAGTPASARDERTGIERFTCPECGRISPARRLRRTRRKYRLALVSLLIFGAAYLTAHIPEYRSGGWVRLIPSTYLAFLAPTDHFKQTLPFAIGFRGAAPVLPMTNEERVGEEAWRRIFAGSMWSWQESLFVWRSVESDRAEWLGRVSYPSQWVAGEKLPLRVEDSMNPRYTDYPLTLEGRVVGGTIFTARSRIYPVATPSTPDTDMPIRLWFKAGRREVYEPTFPGKCHLVKGLSDLFTADDSPQTSQTARDLLDPRIIVLSSNALRLAINERGESDAWRNFYTGLGCRIDVQIDGQTAGTVRYHPSWREEWGLSRRILAITWRVGMESQAQEHPDRIRLHITGDLVESFESYRQWPFEDPNPRCWTGVLDIAPPIEIEEQRPLRQITPQEAPAGRLTQ